MADEDGLERTIEALRAEVTVRDEWRASLEEALRDAPEPVRVLAVSHRAAHRWNVSPVMALAAALVCMIVGAAANQLLQHDENGVNSNASIAASTMGVRFSVLAPGVKRVSIVGDFNGWNALATPLEVSRDGQTWTTMLPLSTGRHAYAFVIDGAVVRDPAAPAAPDEDFGVPNSMVLVSSAR